MSDAESEDSQPDEVVVDQPPEEAEGEGGFRLASSTSTRKQPSR